MTSRRSTCGAVASIKGDGGAEFKQQAVSTETTVAKSQTQVAGGDAVVVFLRLLREVKRP